MIALLVILGGAVGASLRFALDRFVQGRHETVFPWGTLCVNVLACVVLGSLTGAASRVDGRVDALVGTGFCGALSTFSTFSYETLELGRAGSRLIALANVGATLAAGLGGVALGWWLGALAG